MGAQAVKRVRRPMGRVGQMARLGANPDAYTAAGLPPPVSAVYQAVLKRVTRQCSQAYAGGELDDARDCLCEILRVLLKARDCSLPARRSAPGEADADGEQLAPRRGDCRSTVGCLTAACLCRKAQQLRRTRDLLVSACAALPALARRLLVWPVCAVDAEPVLRWFRAECLPTASAPSRGRA